MVRVGAGAATGAHEICGRKGSGLNLKIVGAGKRVLNWGSGDLVMDMESWGVGGSG